jgi:DNA polymerase-3 subunit delta'
MNEEGKKLRTEIRVDDVRRIVTFFGSTPAFGGYRVCIVDSIEEMNASGMNALLKLVEEPPTKSVFLLISHTPGRVMATIRSRCQRMRLNPLSTEEVSQAVTALADRMSDLPREQIPEAAAASGGSVRRALELLLGEGLEVRSLSTEMLKRLPTVDPAKLHTLGDHMRGDQGFAVFTEVVEDWLALQATRENQPRARLARYAETWEKVRRAAIDTDAFGLDRKPFVFQIFAMLADATRR